MSDFRLLVVSRESTRAAALVDAVASRPAGVRVDCRSASVLTGSLAEVADLASQADVILMTHLLTEDLVAPARALAGEHGRADAQVIVLQSLREVLEAGRLGGRAFTQMMRGVPMLAGVLERRDMTGGLRRMIEMLPVILASIPPDRTDLRTYVETMLYWRDPTAENLRNMVLMLADRWGRPAGRFAGHYEAPALAPDCGLWHPDIGIREDCGELPAVEGAGATLGLLLMRGSVLAGDTAAAEQLFRRFEARGMRVIAAFAGSFDFREPIERWFGGVDAVVSLTGFPLVGGHNRHEDTASRGCLAKRDALYLTPANLMVQTTRDWERSHFGLAPIEVAMQLAIHEVEGGIEPAVLQGPAADGGRKQLIDERADCFVQRVEAWLRLRRLENREKRIALTLFSFPPGKGSVGTAAYLDVFRSAHAVLERLAVEGYDVEVPVTPEDLLARVVTGDDKYAEHGGAELAVADRLDRRRYAELVPESSRLKRQWGEPPGTLESDGSHVLIRGVRLGRVFVGVQPSFGYEGDPMRLLFEPSATPHHGFAAYYRWIERVFGAHAVVHVGTHGALEFMPGKQTGLSGACWPTALLGTVPDVYLYAINNPSEATIAKRRGLAVTIGHLTPPAEQAGLYRDLAELRALVAELATEESTERRRRTAEALIHRARALHLDRDVALPDSVTDETAVAIGERLGVALDEIASRRIPVGLHVIGRTPRFEERVELLTAIAEHERPDLGFRSPVRLLLEAAGHDPARVEEGIRLGRRADVDVWAEARETVRRVLARECKAPAGGAFDTALAGLHAIDDALVAGDELTPLIDALAGRYVAPGPGGDPVKSPAVLPSGRNMHALDPAQVPSQAAMRQAEHAVGLLLARRRAELGDWPRRIGMVLWGLDNIKTQGEGIAQAFLLIGTRPRRNSIGRIAEVDVIPLEELGRPRIDVTLQASGIFRDIFAQHLELLDRAVRVVASLDEPAEANFVRAAVETLSARLPRERAMRRVFSNAPGSYGAHVDQMVQTSSWSERSELGRLFAKRKGFAYDTEGAVAEDPEVLEWLAGGIDTTYQNLDSTEVSLIDVDHYFEYLGGLTAYAESVSGERPAAFVADATGSTARVRSLEETVRLETRSKLLNPRWFEGMLRHGYEGVEEVRKRFDYTFGWSATAGAVDAWVYREVHRTYVEDEDVRERMRSANPHSFTALVDRLLEADGRGFWSASENEKRSLTTLQGHYEDQLEGIDYSRM